MQKLYIGEDNLLEVSNLTDAANGQAVSDATVKAEVKSEDGDTIIATNISCAYVASNADGDPSYQGTLGSIAAANLVDGDTYHVFFNMNSKQGWRRVAVEAAYHGARP